jgi:uncharacterized membrane protein YtjA (UPF0391 family)
MSPVDEQRSNRRRPTMLAWVLIFLAIAIVAAVFGFSNLAAAAAGIARVIFFIFIVIFVIALIIHLTGAVA